MKKATSRAVALAAAAIAATTAVASVHAQDSGNWIVRARALYLDPANKDNIDGADVSVNSKVFPAVDISYFFTPNLAAELILTYPQSHDVSLNGTEVGKIKHLPPTLSLQYHFTGMGWRPYVGLGVNYTRLTSVDLPADYALKRDSYGLAIGAGVDVPLGGGWLFNVDVKKVQIKTDVSYDGDKLGTFKIDPLLVGIGIGKRF
ncbi:OmpW/AlkL family protein [Azohydromonas sediminis]|uniref:OmpW/AlkL family protein n=1 Tax=Azohydromonas sediminis TaxID=2259674 RepID=UPI000E64D3E3|nr:OmpW family outer membrane protein [Azohydromonas sediminis]